MKLVAQNLSKKTKAEDLAQFLRTSALMGNTEISLEIIPLLSPKLNAIEEKQLVSVYASLLLLPEANKTFRKLVESFILRKAMNLPID